MFLFLARLRERNLKEEWVGEELSIEAYSGRQKKKKKEKKERKKEKKKKVKFQGAALQSMGN